jgi:hypothetical protein
MLLSSLRRSTRNHHPILDVPGAMCDFLTEPANPEGICETDK